MRGTKDEAAVSEFESADVEPVLDDFGEIGFFV